MVHREVSVGGALTNQSLLIVWETWHIQHWQSPDALSAEWHSQTESHSTDGVGLLHQSAAYLHVGLTSLIVSFRLSVSLHGRPADAQISGDKQHLGPESLDPGQVEWSRDEKEAFSSDILLRLAHLGLLTGSAAFFMSFSLHIYSSIILMWKQMADFCMFDWIRNKFFKLNYLSIWLHVYIKAGSLMSTHI